MPPQPKPDKKLRQKQTFLRAPHELSRRLFVPGQGRALELLGVPRYLPTRVNGWNEVDPAGFLELHKRVLEGISTGNLNITNDAGPDPQVALSVDVTAGTRPLRCLILYFDRPPTAGTENPLGKEFADLSAKGDDNERDPDCEDFTAPSSSAAAAAGRAPPL